MAESRSGNWRFRYWISVFPQVFDYVEYMSFNEYLIRVKQTGSSKRKLVVEVAVASGKYNQPVWIYMHLNLNSLASWLVTVCSY